MTDQPGLFDDTPYQVAPTPDLDGLGHDARRTLRNAQLIAGGTNPGTRLPLHPNAARARDAPGLTCGDCAHLWHKHPYGSDRTFLKCPETAVRADVHSDGPDMRAWWPACTRYTPRDGGAE